MAEFRVQHGNQLVNAFGGAISINGVSSIERVIELINNNRYQNGGPSGVITNQSQYAMSGGVELASTTELNLNRVPPITFVGSAAAQTGDGTDPVIDLTTITDLRENDVVYVSGGTRSADPSIVSAGYTTLAFHTEMIVARKVMGSSVDTTIVCGGAGAVANASYVAMAFRNVDTTTPEDNTVPSIVSSSPPNPPAVTTVTANAAVVVFAVNQYAVTLTAPTGYGDLVQIIAPTGGSNHTSGGAWRIKETPGSENPDAFGRSPNNGSGYAATIALRPANSTVNDCQMSWSAWEYTGASYGPNEFIVRDRRQVNVPSSNTTSFTPSGIVDPTRCIPFITGIINTTSTNGAQHGTATAEINTSTGEVTVYSRAGSGASQVNIVTVEFVGSAWTVHRGGAIGDTDTGVITLDGSVVDWSNGLIIHQFYKGVTPGSNNGIADCWPVYEPNAALNQVDWTFDAQHDGNTDQRHQVYVLEHPDMVVTRFTDTGNLEGANLVDITSAGLTDLAQSLIWISATSSGTGVGYGRGWKNAYFNSLTQVAHWCHRSGNTNNVELQIVDLSGIKSAAEQLVPVGVFLDGATNLRNNSALTGVVNGTTISGSFWVRYTGDPGQYLFVNNNGTLILINGSESIQIIMYLDTFPTDNVTMNASVPLNDGQWHHCCWNVDSSNIANCSMWIDDQDVTNVTNFNMGITFNFTDTPWRLGSWISDSFFYTGDVAEFWLAFNTLVDFSVEDNRRKFVGPEGSHPVYLGSDGSIPTGSVPDVFFSGDLDTWEVNDGTGGGFTESGTLVASSLDMPAYVYLPNGVNFDGSTYLTRGADLTGNADSKLVTGAFWYRSSSANVTTDEVIFSNRGLDIFHRQADELLAIQARDASNTLILSVTSASAINDTDWHHILFSFDMANPSNAYLYIDDVADLSSLLHTDSEIGFERTEHVVGALYTGALLKLSGDLADLWIDFGTYFDFSIEANRRLFVGPDGGSSRFLGSDGSLPTGSPPLVFLSGPTADWHTNDGSGGGFTENGTLTDASLDPPDSIEEAPTFGAAVMAMGL